jgi:hypothetical protein
MKIKREKKVDSKKAMIVKELAITHKCTCANVYNAINGYSKTDNSLAIKKDYDKKYKDITELLK